MSLKITQGLKEEGVGEKGDKLIESVLVWYWFGLCSKQSLLICKPNLNVIHGSLTRIHGLRTCEKVSSTQQITGKATVNSLRERQKFSNLTNLHYVSLPLPPSLQPSEVPICINTKQKASQE